MEYWVRAICACVVVGCLFLPAWASAQVDVTTYHNDNARTGQNTQESILTPANVNSTQFGKIFTVPVDGTVYAQPLYLSNVAIGGAIHDVSYVATEHDSVYAIDADTGEVYWQKSLIPAGGSVVNSGTDLKCGDIMVEVGITGTPVIDRTSGTIYVVAKVKVAGVIRQYLHALDIGTAAEKFGGPVEIEAAVAGTAADGDGSLVAFNARQENQRAALLLENGHVVIGWTSHCDRSPWHGWVMSYGATTLVQEGVYNSSANGYGNGIWMSGGGLAADTGGNIYFATGNGSWNAADRGDSVVKLGPPAGAALPLLDYFTPYNQGSLAQVDNDLSAGGLILLPERVGGKELLVIMGKEGKIFLLDRNNLGKYCLLQAPPCSGSDPQIVQEIPGAMTGLWGTPAFWNGHLYWGGGNDSTEEAEVMKTFSFDAGGSGKISTRPTSVTARAFSFSGPVPSISSNGSANAILWAIDDGRARSTCSRGENCQILFAYDANDLNTMLYNSDQARDGRDQLESAVKFATATVANGKVYVGSRASVSAFGLLQSTGPAGPPPPSSNLTAVNLAAEFNVHGIDQNFVAASAGGLDGTGYSVSENLVGKTVTWSGVTFDLGPALGGSAVSDATLALPAGNYSRLNLLATAVHGNQPDQQFTVTYTDGTASTFTQSLSDWWTPQNYAGEYKALPMAYILTPAGAQKTGDYFLYGYSFAIDPTKTVRSVTLPHNRHVIVLAVTLGNTTPTAPRAATSVNLTAEYNVYGIDADHALPTRGGLDMYGYSISANLAGSSITSAGIKFNLGPTGVANGVSSSNVALPAGHYSALNLLAVAVDGSQTNQMFVVAYSDGTTTRVTQSVSDWWAAQNYAGESKALPMNYVLLPNGGRRPGVYNVYGYSLAIDHTKTVQSVSLPKNRRVIVLAAALTP